MLHILTIASLIQSGAQVIYRCQEDGGTRTAEISAEYRPGSPYAQYKVTTGGLVLTECNGSFVSRESGDLTCMNGEKLPETQYEFTLSARPDKTRGMLVTDRLTEHGGQHLSLVHFTCGY